MPVDTEDPTKPANTDEIGDPDIGIQVEMRALKAKCINMATAIAALQAAGNAGIFPIGAITPYAGAVAPTGFMLCEGQELARVGTYAALFAVVGITFGVGDGVTTFNLPDFRGRVPVAAGTGTGLTARTLGDKVGAETHVLTTPEMPAHTHQVGTYYGVLSGAGNAINSPVLGSTTTDLTSSTGGGGAHNNMQPSLVTSFIIRVI